MKNYVLSLFFIAFSISLHSQNRAGQAESDRMAVAIM